MAIHESYHPMPLQQVFPEVLADYRNAGFNYQLAGYVRGMSVDGQPIDTTLSLDQLRLARGARIDVEMH
jgi:hypothetical protein